MDSSLEETSADSESWPSEMASSLVEASTDSESLPSLVLEPVSDAKVPLSEIPCKWAHKRSTRSALYQYGGGGSYPCGEPTPWTAAGGEPSGTTVMRKTSQKKLNLKLKWLVQEAVELNCTVSNLKCCTARGAHSYIPHARNNYYLFS